MIKLLVFFRETRDLRRFARIVELLIFFRETRDFSRFARIVELLIFFRETWELYGWESCLFSSMKLQLKWTRVSLIRKGTKNVLYFVTVTDEFTRIYVDVLYRYRLYKNIPSDRITGKLLLKSCCYATLSEFFLRDSEMLSTMKLYEVKYSNSLARHLLFNLQK